MHQSLTWIHKTESLGKVINILYPSSSAEQLKSSCAWDFIWLVLVPSLHEVLYCQAFDSAEMYRRMSVLHFPLKLGAASHLQPLISSVELRSCLSLQQRLLSFTPLPFCKTHQHPRRKVGYRSRSHRRMDSAFSSTSHVSRRNLFGPTAGTWTICPCILKQKETQSSEKHTDVSPESDCST